MHTMADTPASDPSETASGSARPSAGNRGREHSLFARFRAVLASASSTPTRSAVENRTIGGKSADTQAQSPQTQSPQAQSLQAAEMRLSRARRFETLRVEDVMVPRADIISVELESELLDVARIIAESAHSRLPVYRETLDEPLGMVHIRDVVPHLIPPVGQEGDDRAAAAEDMAERQSNVHLQSILRPVLYVPGSMPAADLLLKMQTRRVHMAIVVDEFGGTDGLVTLEDLVEEIVGNIEDEHDDDEAPQLKKRSAHCWEAEARTPLEEIEKALGAELVEREELSDIDTLGGLVFSMVGRVPERGEVISHEGGFDFEVMDADARRIKRVVIRRRDTGRRDFGTVESVL
jgi:CBS domain containing-hemolysin-like protein